MTDERNTAIVSLFRQGVTKRALAQAYGITTSRITQIIARQDRRDAQQRKLELKALGVSDAAARAHDNPRPHGTQGEGYSAAASIQQHERLLQWERAAADVREAQEEMAARGLTDFAGQTRSLLAANARALHHQRWERIREIRSEYRALPPEVQAERKPALAAQIDQILAALPQ